MTSPPAAVKPLQGASNFFGRIFRRNRSLGELRDGSSRRGRRYYEDDLSAGRDSSTRSIMFDLELSHKGGSQRGGSQRGGSQRGGSGGSQRGGNGSQRGHPTTADIISRLHLATLESADQTTTSTTTTATLQSSRNTKPAATTQSNTNNPTDPHRVQAILTRIAYLGRPTASFEVDLLQDVQALRPGATDHNGVLDLHRLALDLIAMGYECAIQANNQYAADNNNTNTNNTNSTTTNNNKLPLDHVCHEFLVCSGRLDGSIRHHCLVDPRFRDQFELGKPTEAYATILQSVPREFVGSPLRLQALADVLCNQIAIVYKLQRMPLPPWRRSSAMLSRWFDVQTQAQQPANNISNNSGNRSMTTSSSNGNGGGMNTNNNNNNTNSTNDTTIEQQLQERSSSAELITQTSSGGSAQFYAMVAVHQEALKRQREQRGDTTHTGNNTSNNNHGNMNSSCVTDVASEKSNKPRRQRQLYMEQQQQQQQQQYNNNSSSIVINTTNDIYSSYTHQSNNDIQQQQQQPLRRSKSSATMYEPVLASIIESPHPRYLQEHPVVLQQQQREQQQQQQQRAVLMKQSSSPLHNITTTTATKSNSNSSGNGVVSLLAQGLKSMKKGMVKVSSRSSLNSGNNNKKSDGHSKEWAYA